MASMTLKDWCKENNRMDLLEEWNYEKNGDLKPEMFKRASNRKVWWKCSKCGNEWQAMIKSRSERKPGCPVCKSVK